jgi:hypothetical protein
LSLQSVKDTSSATTDHPRQTAISWDIPTALQAQTGGIERQRSATEWAICLTRFFRSIAPKKQRPKNRPVHGLNVIAFARIQTISNFKNAPRRKGRFAPLARWPAGQP